MKKILLIVFLFFLSKIEAQILECSPQKFTGVAPSPWAIDGQMTDWQTLLGTYSGNPTLPFGTTLGTNASYDTYGSNDPDNPDPKSDLRVLSRIHDDYNTYFYFRRTDNNNFPNKAFYFLDTNIDGLLNSGEPVISVNFNSKKVNKLSLGRYISFNTGGDPIGNPCVVDGFPVQGRVDEILNSNNTSLLSNEVFAAAVTEDGYGVELSVPWRLISQYKYFTYHLALQKGSGSFNPALESDNASGCGRLLDIVGEPDFELASSSVQTLVPGFSYRLTATFRNLTPGELRVTAATLISFENIVQQNGLPVDETQFGVTVRGVNYYYINGTFNNQPIEYTVLTIDPTAGLITIPALSTGAVTIDVRFPPNGSVKSADVKISPRALFNFLFKRGCIGGIGGGGKPINPVGFTIDEEEPGDEEPTRSIKQKQGYSIEGNATENRIRVYPNPSRDFTNVNIQNEMGLVDILLTDFSGRIIRKISNVNPGVFRLNNPGPGIYLLNVKSKNGTFQETKKIIYF